MRQPRKGGDLMTVDIGGRNCGAEKVRGGEGIYGRLLNDLLASNWGLCIEVRQTVRKVYNEGNRFHFRRSSAVPSFVHSGACKVQKRIVSKRVA